MKFEYTGRHVEVSSGIRSHVEDHFKKLDHIFNDSTAWAHVIIDVEKNRQIGELVVHWRDHTLTAKDTNADMYMALTRAIAKIEKQAIKLKKKIIDRKQSARPTAAVAPSPDGHLEATPGPPRIIPARRYQVKPMTAEEAALDYFRSLTLSTTLAIRPYSSANRPRSTASRGRVRLSCDRTSSSASLSASLTRG